MTSFYALLGICPNLSFLPNLLYLCRYQLTFPAISPLVPSPLLHILLIVCAAVAGVSLIVSIALFSRRFICRPRRRSQFFDESQDFIYDSSSSGPNQKYISHLIPPMQKSGSLSAIKMQRRG